MYRRRVLYNSLLVAYRQSAISFQNWRFLGVLRIFVAWALTFILWETKTCDHRITNKNQEIVLCVLVYSIYLIFLSLSDRYILLKVHARTYICTYRSINRPLFTAPSRSHFHGLGTLIILRGNQQGYLRNSSVIRRAIVRLQYTQAFPDSKRAHCPITEHHSSLSLSAIDRIDQWLFFQASQAHCSFVLRLL